MSIITNWPLLDETLLYIVDNPDSYDQCTWISRCGSERCVAGWITHHAGFVPYISASYDVYWVVPSERPDDREAATGVDVAAVAALMAPESDDGAAEFGEAVDLHAVLFESHLDWGTIGCNLIRIAEVDGHTLPDRVLASFAETGHYCGRSTGNPLHFAVNDYAD